MTLAIVSLLGNHVLELGVWDRGVSKHIIAWCTLVYLHSVITIVNFGKTTDLPEGLLQGDQKRQHIVIFLWRNQLVSKLHKPNDFCIAYIGRFWYFDVQYFSGANYSFVSGLWQNSVTAPYRRDWEPRYSQTNPRASYFHEYHSDTPRHPPDIPQTPTRHLQGAGDANRQQQTPPDKNRQPQTPKDTDKCCLSTSGGVCWRLLLSVGIACSLGMSRGCLGDVWWGFGGI